MGIAPFAAHKGKMYPLDLIQKVIHELSKDYKIVLFGGGDDEIQRLNEFNQWETIQVVPANIREIIVNF